MEKNNNKNKTKKEQNGERSPDAFNEDTGSGRINILKTIYQLLPIKWVINILARIFIGSTTIAFLQLNSTVSTWYIELIIYLWMFIPIYDMFRSFYHSILGDQTWRTILLNDLYNSSYRANKSEKSKTKQRKLRIWVEKNPEINLFNYWYLKFDRRKGWINIKNDVIRERISLSTLKEQPK